MPRTHKAIIFHVYFVLMLDKGFYNVLTKSVGFERCQDVRCQGFGDGF